LTLVELAKWLVQRGYQANSFRPMPDPLSAILITKIVSPASDFVSNVSLTFNGIPARRASNELLTTGSWAHRAAVFVAMNPEEHDAVDVQCRGRGRGGQCSIVNTAANHRLAPSRSGLSSQGP
jgi:hypothetical protein